MLYLYTFFGEKKKLPMVNGQFYSTGRSSAAAQADEHRSYIIATATAPSDLVTTTSTADVSI
jgi:hypothetical protein